jgi:hypothetical protein
VARNRGDGYVPFPTSLLQTHRHARRISTASTASASSTDAAAVTAPLPKSGDLPRTFSAGALLSQGEPGSGKGHAWGGHAASDYAYTAQRNHDEMQRCSINFAHFLPVRATRS